MFLFFLMIAKFKKYYRFNFKKYWITKYDKLLMFFFICFFILFIRLFDIQILNYDKYNNLLISQHYNVSNLEPIRWNIYLEDKNENPIALTENINLYNLYADPYIIWDRNKLSKLLTPILYKHFCVRYKLDKVDKFDCIKNIEKFSWKEILKKEELVSTWNNIKIDSFLEKDLTKFDTWFLENIINEKLNFLLKKSYITKAYLWFYEDDIIKKLKKEDIDWLTIQNDNYVYIDLDKINNFDKTISLLYNILHEVNKKINIKYLTRILNKRPRRYVKIADFVNPKWIAEIKKLKEKYKKTKKNKVPLFHWIWFNKQPFRFYPYGSFLSHVIWYINWWKWVWWIEWYFDDILKWKKWKIIWMNTPWIWTIWSNSIIEKNPQNWADIYLTIDQVLQQQVEKIIKKDYYDFRADNVSIVIINPFNWQVKALAWYPNFDPNNWKQIYKIKPLTSEYNYLLSGNFAKTYVDVPILIETWWKLKNATFKERFDKKYKKFIFKNLFWPRTFVNQVISDPYEPGSIFKVMTEAIAIDSKNIKLYDYYTDKWKIKVWPYTIKNVAKECRWYNTFLHALERSCNVWMVKIVIKTWKYIYYNYLEQLWFGKKTWIQLEGEHPWKISALEKFSKARFYNNSFGQWILVTPIQMAIAYSAAVNGWFLIKPTIVKKIVTSDWIINIKKIILNKVFSTWISKDIIYALYSTIYNWDLKSLIIPWYTVWWKTWTSQIAFKWRYQRWNWWTIWSFVWIVTKENLKYVIAIKVSRPRKCQWWICTAWKIFKDVAWFIIQHEWIKK